MPKHWITRSEAEAALQAYYDMGDCHNIFSQMSDEDIKAEYCAACRMGHDEIEIGNDLFGTDAEETIDEWHFRTFGGMTIRPAVRMLKIRFDSELR